MLTWLILGAYLALQLGIGYYISQKIKTKDDYFLAGRSLGVFAATFSIFATWFGAETCIGSSAAIFDGGLASSKADPFGYTLCLVLAAIFLASQLWKRGILTLGDLYRERFSDKVEKIAAFVIIPSSLIWGAAQLQAFGQILSVVTDIHFDTTLIIATVIVVAYTSLGGLMADVVNDVVQGFILIIGLGSLLVMSVIKMGGVTPTVQAMLADPTRLTFISQEESFLMQLDTWMIPILGSVIAQEMISRMLAARSPEIARRATFNASVLYFVVALIPVCLGLIGSQLVAGTELPHNEQFLPVLARQLLPDFLFVIFSGAIIAAILSTIDSTLLAVSAFVNNNIFHKQYAHMSNKKQVFLARFVLVCSGLVAFLIAVSGEGVYALVETASSFGAAGVVVVTFGGLWSKRFGGAYAAGTALVVGVVAKPVIEYLFEFDAPFLASMLTALATYLSIGFLENKNILPKLIPEHITKPEHHTGKASHHAPQTT